MSMLMDQIKENARFYIQSPSVGHILFPISTLVQDKCALLLMGLAMTLEEVELVQQTQISCYL